MRGRMLRTCAAWVAGVLLAPAVLGASPRAAAAQELLAPRASPAELPANDQAHALIDSAPGVLEARRNLEAARHRAAMQTAGPNEWTARASAQRRSYQGPNGDVREWSVGLERALRFGGKAEIDRELATAQLRLAEARLRDARHDAARGLLDLWLDWLTANRAQRLWGEQLGFARTSLAAAGTRRRAGDASLMEQNAARADLAEVQRQLSGAANEEAKARARLRSRFPSLQLDAPVLAPFEAVPWGPEDAQWRDRILAENDLVRIARQELQQAELTAARARANRVADPTVGMHATSEAGGRERIVGFTVSIPIGGAYRAATEREALAQVEVARAAVERILWELESDISESLTDARGSLERWQFAEQARAATQDNARLTQRAYALGEADLQAVLLARRQLVDAELGASEALSALSKARYRLLVDARLIWGLHDE